MQYILMCFKTVNFLSALSLYPPKTEARLSEAKDGEYRLVYCKLYRRSVWEGKFCLTTERVHYLRCPVVPTPHVTVSQSTLYYIVHSIASRQKQCSRCISHVCLHKNSTSNKPNCKIRCLCTMVCTRRSFKVFSATHDLLGI